MEQNRSSQMENIVQKKRRIRYLSSILIMLTRRVNRVESKKNELIPQVANLAELVSDFEKERTIDSISSLFRLKIKLDHERARLQRKLSKNDEKKGTKCSNHKCPPNLIIESDGCVGRVCPISLAEITSGVCMRGICYDRKSLVNLFKSQYDSGQHLHDPIVRVIGPTEFNTLFDLGLITREMRDALVLRYPASLWQPAGDPERRFQLERKDQDAIEEVFSEV